MGGDEWWKSTRASQNNARPSKPYFNAGWTLRDIVREQVGMPSFEKLADVGSWQRKLETGEDTSMRYWIDKHTKDIKDTLLPRFMEALRMAKSDDAETIRRLIISIATNPNNYGVTSGGFGDMEKTMINAGMGTKVEAPTMRFTVGKASIVNYLSDIIKYVYADLIFKAIELPVGTIAKQTNDKYVYANAYMLKNTDILTMRKVVPV